MQGPEVKRKWLDIAGVASRHCLGSGTNVKLPLVRENGQGWVYLCPSGVSVMGFSLWMRGLLSCSFK